MKNTIKTTILAILLILIGLGLIAAIVNGINSVSDSEIKVSSSSAGNINETFKIEDIPEDEWAYNWGPLLCKTTIK